MPLVASTWVALPEVRNMNKPTNRGALANSSLLYQPQPKMHSKKNIKKLRFEITNWQSSQKSPAQSPKSPFATLDFPKSSRLQSQGLPTGFARTSPGLKGPRLDVMGKMLRQNISDIIPFLIHKWQSWSDSTKLDFGWHDGFLQLSISLICGFPTQSRWMTRPAAQTSHRSMGVNSSNGEMFGWIDFG